MANYFCIFSAPDNHIDFMEKYPGSDYFYYEGTLPEFEQLEIKTQSFFEKLFGKNRPPLKESFEKELPADWPDREAESYGPEVNHRNVALYHRILNNTAEEVVGAGSIFQSWLSRNHSAISLDNGMGESFAFKSHLIPELLALAEKVSAESILTQYTGWCHELEKNHEPNIEECEFLLDDFRRLIPGLQKAIEMNCGIVWVTS